MGLGPPVCSDCEIILRFNDSEKSYYCPICQYAYENLYNPLKPTHLWELTTEKQKEYSKNTKNIKRKINNVRK